MAVNSIAELCPTSEVLEGLSITSADLNNANALASQWLDQIGLNERKILHENQNLQMEVSFENAVLYGWLEDNVTAQDFVSMFPINLEFEDYNHVEKISYLSEGIYRGKLWC